MRSRSWMAVVTQLAIACSAATPQPRLASTSAPQAERQPFLLGQVISACQTRLDEAVRDYKVRRESAKHDVTIDRREHPRRGHHGELPSVTFVVTGDGNSLQIVWYQGRHHDPQGWSANESLRFLGAAIDGSVAILWGAEDAGWKPFAAAFQPAAEACMDTFSGKSGALPSERRTARIYAALPVRS